MDQHILRTQRYEDVITYPYHNPSLSMLIKITPSCRTDTCCWDIGNNVLVIQGHLLLTKFAQTSTEIRTWISNCIHTTQWDVICHPYPNYNSGLTKPPLKWGRGWLNTTQNNGTITHSCSDLRWSRSKCSPSPVNKWYNATQNWRKNKSTTLFADQIHTNDCTQYCIIECLKILIIYDDTPLKVLCETKYTYTTKSNRINRNEIHIHHKIQ